VAKKAGVKQQNNRGRKNLAPRWKKGESGNPKGRPKKKACITSLMRDYLEQVPDVLPNGHPNNAKKTWALIFAESIVRRACSGDPSASREVLDRMEGKVAEHIKVGPEIMSADEAANVLGMLDGRKAKN